jgi:tRNA(adenine34) deaminase
LRFAQSLDFGAESGGSFFATLSISVSASEVVEAFMTAKSRVRRKTKSGAAAKAKKGKRWVAGVKTVSTFPPEGLFTKSAATIAKALASKKVSPKGPASGMRMLNYFINRAGRGLSADRRKELEKAKKLLSAKIQREK